MLLAIDGESRAAPSSQLVVEVLLGKLFFALFLVSFAAADVQEVTSEGEFKKILANNAAVAVDFFSTTCGPCIMIAPKFKEACSEFADTVKCIKVDVQSAYVGVQIRSMPTFHFYEDGVKRHEFSGAGEYQLRQLAERVANDAAAKNVKLSTEALQDFYNEHDSGKDISPILKKCASLAKSKDCVGGAARELAKKLKQKFGSAPQLSKRFGEQEPPKPKPKRTSRSLDQASTDELLAELAKRSDDDDLAFAATEAAELARKELEEEDEDDDEEDDEGALPLYRPHGQFAERVVIVGAGPGGLSAAVYAARAGLAPVVIAPSDGGQLLGKGVTVENYPGVVGDTGADPASGEAPSRYASRRRRSRVCPSPPRHRRVTPSLRAGPGLVHKMQAHAADCGAAFYPHKVHNIDLSQRPFRVETPEANISAHSLIVATGADSRWLGVDGESTYRGGGVSSCATCDGFLFRDMDVAVVGGGDTAMEDALVLARTSKSVTVVHRRDAFRASRALADRVREHPKIRIRWNATVSAFKGEEVHEDEVTRQILTRVDLKDNNGEKDHLDVRAAFVAIGHDPNTKLFGGLLKTNDQGYLELSGGRFATELSVEGVFAAGDVADPVYRQAITSAGSGAMAALDAERYLSEQGIQDESERFADDLMAELMGEFDTEDTYNAYSEGVDLSSANARAEL